MCHNHIAPSGLLLGSTNDKDMQITFKIEYHTQWGEMVGVLLEDSNQPLMLTTTDGIIWEGTHDLRHRHNPQTTMLAYRYAIYRNDTCTRVEHGRISHTFDLAANPQAEYIVYDSWRDLPQESHLFTSAFSGERTDQVLSQKPLHQAHNSIGLRCLCPCLSRHGLALGISGSSPALGGWNPEQAICMNEVMPGVWHLSLDTALHYINTEYKFVAIDTTTHRIVHWESGDNRYLYIPSLSGNIMASRHWQMQEVEIYFDAITDKLSGTAIPLFALRSEGSQGVGDFGDLKRMVDWAEHTHQDVIQILPINDTTISHTWLDSYPYKAISIYALHPMFIDLRQLPVPSDKAFVAKYEEYRKGLNALECVDYEGVCKLKHQYLRSLYDEIGEEVLASEPYRDFELHNDHWLKPYAAFSYLRDLYGTANFRFWPSYAKYNQAEILKLYNNATSKRDILYYQYLQFVLHQQLLDTSRYAKQRGIVLKGDIPIGITPESVEAWTTPEYFNMDGQAGAPPDAFSRNGQNWGFPTYKWDVMAKDGYSWWKNRFTGMAQYFSAYRIDHILGFFRIWEIPMHSVHGLLGHFEPALPMSIDEIKSYGLDLDLDFMVKPYIDTTLINRLFGQFSENVISEYLKPIGDDRYALKPEFDTQRKVQTWFSTKGRELPFAETIREGLYSLISNVLFVPDPKDEGSLHPRICAQDDYTYSILTRQQQEAFNLLYYHYFYQRHNDFWKDSAMQKLPNLLDQTSMLACGEDLGMVPNCVPYVMQELQILTLEIQRMPKTPGTEFATLAYYPTRSVCTTGTHDMTTLRGWWREDKAQTTRYYQSVLGHEGLCPEDATPAICEQVIKQHLESPSILCVLPFQDWLSIDAQLRRQDIQAERINVPADPRNYWHYRMHLTLDELMQAEEFNTHIRELIDQTRRA